MMKTRVMIMIITTIETMSMMNADADQPRRRIVAAECEEAGSIDFKWSWDQNTAVGWAQQNVLARYPAKSIPLDRANMMEWLI